MKTNIDTRALLQTLDDTNQLLEQSKTALSRALADIAELHGVAHPLAVAAHCTLKELCRLQAQLYAVDIIAHDVRREVAR